MKKCRTAGGLALAGLLVCILVVMFRWSDRRTSAPFEVGKVLPAHIREGLDLTDEQLQQIEALEKDVRKRLQGILTEKQLNKVEKTDRGTSFGLFGSEKPSARDTTSPPAIAWFSTLEDGLAEARRTGKPIFFLSAAPHCAGVSGIW
jgi:hypothetical protein